MFPLTIVTCYKPKGIAYVKRYSKHSPNSNIHQYLKPRCHFIHRYQLQCWQQAHVLCFQNWTTRECKERLWYSHRSAFLRFFILMIFTKNEQQGHSSLCRKMTRFITCINVKLFMLHKTRSPTNSCCNFQSHAAKLEDELLILLWNHVYVEFKKWKKLEGIFRCVYTSLTEEIIFLWHCLMSEAPSAQCSRTWKKPDASKQLWKRY